MLGAMERRRTQVDHARCKVGPYQFVNRMMGAAGAAGWWVPVDLWRNIFSSHGPRKKTRRFQACVLIGNQVDVISARRLPEILNSEKSRTATK